MGDTTDSDTDDRFYASSPPPEPPPTPPYSSIERVELLALARAALGATPLDADTADALAAVIWRAARDHPDDAELAAYRAWTQPPGIARIHDRIAKFHTDVAAMADHVPPEMTAAARSHAAQLQSWAEVFVRGYADGGDEHRIGLGGIAGIDEQVRLSLAGEYGRLLCWVWRAAAEHPEHRHLTALRDRVTPPDLARVFQRIDAFHTDVATLAEHIPDSIFAGTVIADARRTCNELQIKAASAPPNFAEYDQFLQAYYDALQQACQHRADDP